MFTKERILEMETTQVNITRLQAYVINEAVKDTIVEAYLGRVVAESEKITFNSFKQVCLCFTVSGELSEDYQHGIFDVWLSAFFHVEDLTDSELSVILSGMIKPTIGRFEVVQGVATLIAAKPSSNAHRSVVDTVPRTDSSARTDSSVVIIKLMQWLSTQDWNRRLRNAMRELSGVAQASTTKPVRSGTGDIESFFEGNHQRMESLNLEDFPDVPHGILSSRTWGTEVEHVDCNGIDTPSGWTRTYDDSLESINEDSECSCDLECWHNVECDCDLVIQCDETCTEECDGDHGVGECEADHECEYSHECGEWHSNDSETGEFVSPILRSYHSQGLEQLCEDVEFRSSNDSAGIHVHVAMGDLSAKQIGSLVYGYQVIEPMLEAAYRRKTRSYCKTRNIDDFIQTERDARTVGDPQDLHSGDRYVSLNLAAITKHGTIEFRAMGNDYNYARLIRWAYVCRELVNAAKNGAKPSDWNKVHDFRSLQKFFMRFGEETVVAQVSTQAISKALDSVLEKIEI